MLLQIIFIGAAVSEFYSKLCLGHQFGLAQPLMAFRKLDSFLNQFWWFLVRFWHMNPCPLCIWVTTGYLCIYLQIRAWNRLTTVN
jgi:hypothetical protein